MPLVFGLWILELSFSPLKADKLLKALNQYYQQQEHHVQCVSKQLSDIL